VKTPWDRGVAVSVKRQRKWLADFGGYRHQVTPPHIDSWLKQFHKKDRDVAARVLDSVDFVGFTKISRLYKELLNAIPGWHFQASKRQGKWRFVPFSDSAGESGDSMLHLFRLANGLDRKEFNELFIHRSDLLRSDLASEDTVVFVDDFSGSGDTVCGSWKLAFQELLHMQPRTYIVLLGATQKACKRIGTETDLTPVTGFRLSNKHNIFDSTCGHFNNNEKEIILKYCKIADPKEPQGYKAGGLVVVFAHRCPNNTIPILHEESNKWSALFRRAD
jgi:hypothetical protein